VSVPQPVIDAVRGAQRIVCATHSPMDGDGLGCGLALQRALRAAGKECTLVTEARVPRAYAFLDGHDGIVHLLPADPVPDGDLLLGLDAGEEDRLGRALSQRPAGMRVVNIDHHVSNRGWGDVAWVDAAAAATGEQIHALLVALDLPFDAIAAQCLLVSLVTDTGRFCYSSTTARTLEIAADLLRRGADPDVIQRRLYGAVPLAVHRLRARAVERVAFFSGGRLAVLTVPGDFGEDLGLGGEEVKDLIDLVIGIEGVLIGALVRGLPAGGTKVSLRSKSDAADVAAFAARYGGGGHVRAAGLSADAEPDAAAASLIPALERLVVAARR
jgi:phosphoesterase RecJ-like protein